VAVAVAVVSVAEELSDSLVTSSVAVVSVVTAVSLDSVGSALEGALPPHALTKINESKNAKSNKRGNCFI
jgi:hypothetical protein